MKRFILNIVLLVVILLTMGFHFLPQLVHEVLGLFLLAGTLWHLALNRRWFSNLMKGIWHKLRCLQTVLGLGLAISFLVSVISGIIISNHVFRELWTGVALHRSIFVHQLHIASAYAMVILCGMHIGMHWSSLWSRMKKWPIIGILADKPSLRFGVLVLIGWTGCALARLDHVGDRLLMKHIFGTLASQLPSILYYAMLLCMMGIYAMGFYYLQKQWQQKAIPRKGGAGK